MNVYDSRTGDLPPRLGSFRALPYSWEEFAERAMNGQEVAPSTGVPLSARPKSQKEKPHQKALREAITYAYQAGAPGFIASYPTGSGKRRVAIDALSSMDAHRVLIVAPLNSLASWRSEIQRFYVGRAEIVLINPHGLHRLFAYGGLAHATLEQRAFAGEPMVDFDVIVVDESQILANPSSWRSRLWRKLVRWGTPDAGVSRPDVAR